MPGTNAGTGQPLTLRCAKCRKSDVRRGTSRGTNLEATGRLRPVTHRGVRQTNRKIQYRCRDCGHVGWTQHIDAERLFKTFLDHDLAAPSEA
jgi:predicted RNA-binding Zn-ribbon protein involved in translation (DUF1610 family)